MGSVRIFLSGPMAAGKSTVARVLAARLDVVALDLDELVEAREGRSVPELFRAGGEASFRALERAEAERVVERPGSFVLSLGGGTVTDTPLRRRLLAAGTLVTLTAPVAVLARRAGGGEGRPLLAGSDVEDRLATLVAERADAYGECHATLDTSALEPDEVAARIATLAHDAPVVVPLGRRSYPVEIGSGVRARLAGRSAAAAPGSVLVVTDSHVAERYGRPATDAVIAAGRAATMVTLPAGEESKHLGSVERIWDAALEGSLDRDGLVCAVGGGVVGDLAGFAASTLFRGVAFGQLPTSLLAMVDSSVGGKTGFNRPAGKNLVGTFHQPRFVLCDVDVLGTLPERERRAGLAEVVKSAWLEGHDAVRTLEAEAEALAAGDGAATARAIRMAVGLKARIVTEDEREADARMLLNLGHTVGHAIEAVQGYRGLRHGEAVALGLVAAVRLARALGLAAADDVERMERLLGALGLPTEVDAHLGPELAPFLAADKKRRGGRVRFVCPHAPGRASIVPLAVEDLLELVRA
jgi:shikimate kinase/3-dehydroquinate synthase